MEPDDFVILMHESQVKIVVFTAPSLKEIRESVDVYKGLRRDCYGAAEQSIIRQIKAKRVYRGTHVSRASGASINISQRQRHQINVLHHQAGKVFLQRILKMIYLLNKFHRQGRRTHLSTDVEELRTIERLRVALLDDEYLVVNLLLPEVVVKVA